MNTYYIRNAVKMLACLGVLLTISSAATAQKLELEIIDGIERGIPIAIVPFRIIDASEIKHNVDEIVRDNLAVTGKFEHVSKENYLSFPSRKEEVRYKDWRFINAEALVIGEVWKLGANRYEIQYRIFDVARKQEIGTGKRIPDLTAEDLRTAAHVISDDVYQAFTGRPAAFYSRIAYVTRKEIEYKRFRYRLMVADWDGYDAQEVFASWKPVLSPSWSPDGNRIAFVSYSKKGPIIRVINQQTGDVTTVANFAGVNSAPAWSPDGLKLAYSSSRHGSPDIFVYDLQTQEHTRMSTHYGIDTEPAWSPDGSSLLFTSNRSGKPQVYQLELTSQEISRVTFQGKENANASYDFEGKQIVMVHNGGQITVMQDEDNQMTWLTNAKFDESPSFSPNGDMVLYATEQGFEPAIVVASSDGRVRTRLKYVKGDVREPAWSPIR